MWECCRLFDQPFVVVVVLMVVYFADFDSQSPLHSVFEGLTDQLHRLQLVCKLENQQQHPDRFFFFFSSSVVLTIERKEG